MCERECFITSVTNKRGLSGATEGVDLGSMVRPTQSILGSKKNLRTGQEAGLLF